MIATPNLTAFQALQEGELQRAIERGRARAAILASQGFGLNRQSPSTIETKLKWWTSSATAHLSSRQKTTDLVKPDWGKITADLRQLVESIGEAAVEALDRNLGEQALQARERWPVYTGLSRALLAFTITVEPHRIRGSLMSGAPYTPYIRESVVYDVQRGTGQLVPRPGQQIHIDKRGRKRSRKTGLPPWKAMFLRKIGSAWVFDESAYRKGKAALDTMLAQGSTVAEAVDAARAAVRGIEIAEDRKDAEGHPYQDTIVKPTPSTATAVSRDISTHALDGAPK